jgi:hypothetical protein
LGLTISNVSIGGANATDFAETDNCGINLSAGLSCKINVTFAPTATGTRTGILNIANNLSGTPLAVVLTGSGVAAVRIASLPSSTLVFTSQMVGAISADQALTLSNGGNEPLIISNMAISGTNSTDFAETDNCGGRLSAGASCSCSINITYIPTTTGFRMGRSSTLTIQLRGESLLNCAEWVGSRHG